MKKFFLFLAVGFLLIIAQSIWRMTIPLGSPDFIFIMIVYSGIYRNRLIGPLLAFVLGICIDALYGLQPGMFAVIYTASFFLARLSGRRFYMRSYPFQLLIVVAITALAKLLQFAILRTLDPQPNLAALIWDSTWRQMIWNGVFAIPIVSVLERIDLWTEDDYSDRFMGRIGVF
ncbi:MAG TPA: rod shape-determining protein MreD [bacterium]|nr:rod shape-determining protein MreD [bacterium]